MRNLLIIWFDICAGVTRRAPISGRFNFSRFIVFYESPFLYLWFRFIFIGSFFIKVSIVVFQNSAGSLVTF